VAVVTEASIGAPPCSGSPQVCEHGDRRCRRRRQPRDRPNGPRRSRPLAQGSTSRSSRTKSPAVRSPGRMSAPRRAAHPRLPPADEHAAAFSLTTRHSESVGPAANGLLPSPGSKRDAAARRDRSLCLTAAARLAGDMALTGTGERSIGLSLPAYGVPAPKTAPRRYGREAQRAAALAAAQLPEPEKCAYAARGPRQRQARRKPAASASATVRAHSSPVAGVMTVVSYCWSNGKW
jgi:hypothetical protein